MREINVLRLNQSVWFFDKNIWKPIHDKIYDYDEKTGFYTLEENGKGYNADELYTSKNKCIKANEITF